MLYCGASLTWVPFSRFSVYHGCCVTFIFYFTKHSASPSHGRPSGLWNVALLGLWLLLRLPPLVSVSIDRLDEARESTLDLDLDCLGVVPGHWSLALRSFTSVDTDGLEKTPDCHFPLHRRGKKKPALPQAQSHYAKKSDEVDEFNLLQFSFGLLGPQDILQVVCP